SKTCDAVLIATPHYEHPRLAVLAFENGLHVLCEKPAGVYTKQVREMNTAADRSGLVFAMMFNQRTNHVYRKMHELVKSGEYGRIKRVNWIITDWYRTQAYYNSGGWRATWAGEGGGVLLNQCPHNLDLLQWICGMPSKVQAFCHNGKWHEIEVEDDVTAYLEYPGGATGVFVTTTGDAPGTNRFEITLERAKLVCENDKLMMYELEINEREYCFTATEGFAKPAGNWVEVESDGENPQHAGVLRAFTGKILHGTPLIAEGKEGIHGLTLSNAMHLSSWLKAPVEIPFDEELYLTKLNELRASSSTKSTVEEATFSTEGSFGAGRITR
ncbi:MAG: gfo/Idh/MocA family oxidoreductase, partial [Firmicutes bacterium]|nr:gfo/Idh/MocA family oxidoreductase [Bacillota bacterium]